MYGHATLLSRLRFFLHVYFYIFIYLSLYSFLLKRRNFDFLLFLFLYLLLSHFLLLCSLSYTVNSYLRDTANGPRLFRQTVAEEFRQGENCD